MTKSKAKPGPSRKRSYSPTSDERAAIEKLIEERKVPIAPRLKYENAVVSFDHPDETTGHMLMLSALGTHDSEFMTGLLSQLAQAVSFGPQLAEDELNYVVSFIKGINPRDQVEATLAAQMALVNKAFMKFAGYLPHQQTLPQLETMERSMNKCARTFTIQMEALKRYRNGGEQKVTVHHVSVSEGGQAIVGNVTQNPREDRPDKAPSPPTLTHSKKVPMEALADAPRRPHPIKR